MHILKDLPEPIQGLYHGEYWLVSIDFDKALVRVRKRRDGDHAVKNLMDKLVDPNLIGTICDQIYRGNLSYKVSPWPKGA